jgi:hypothetical protein
VEARSMPAMTWVCIGARLPPVFNDTLEALRAPNYAILKKPLSWAS